MCPSQCNPSDGYAVPSPSEVEPSHTLVHMHMHAHYHQIVMCLTHVHATHLHHWQLLTSDDAIVTTRANIAARAKLPDAGRIVCRYRELPDEVLEGRPYHRKSHCINLDPSMHECNWQMGTSNSWPLKLPSTAKTLR